MKKILITGGPVHAYLDDVKIITNKFKGGLMAELADKFLITNDLVHKQEEDKVHITYLCSKDSKKPGYISDKYCDIIIHDGVDSYMKKVLFLAPHMDVIVLGAAVANLIPKNKIEGKFPSHNYKPGDTIPIEFTIAPRIIDQVKKANPKVLLFGYKLLSGVDHYELVRAAYGVLLESKAVTVFANDAKDLMQKYAVTKERAVHAITNSDVMQWILDRMEEKYYSTILSENDDISKEQEYYKSKFKKLLIENKNSFIKSEEGFVFGSGAIRIDDSEETVESEIKFVTTARGKNELEDFAFVNYIDNSDLVVHCGTTKKASLNSPLFYFIFHYFPNVKSILHYHHQRADLITKKYATPGTDIDSIRMDTKSPSFNIEGHGCILSYDIDRKLIK